MRIKNKPPYPTAMEFVRAVLNSLDMKQGVGKELDDQCKSVFVDHRLVDQLIDEYFFETLKKYGSLDLAQSLPDYLKFILVEYHKLICNVPLDGVPRAEALLILAEHWFSWVLNEFTIFIKNHFSNLPIIEILDPNNSSVSVVFNWVEQNYPWWQDHHKRWSKDEKTKVSKYRNGNELPSPLSLKQLFNTREKGMPDVRSLLLMARACDDLKKKTIGPCILRTLIKQLHNKRQSYNFGHEMSLALANYSQHYEALQIPSLSMYESLKLRALKGQNAQLETRENLDKLNRLFSVHDPENETTYYLSWLEGRWNVFAGDLDKANENYKEAFEQALYRAGKNQELIIHEALAVAAMCNDSVFLKKLKQTCILFELNLPVPNDSIETGKPRTKASDFIEDWEISNWQSYFKSIFPKEGLFAETVYDEKGHTGSYSFIQGENQPDFHRVNSKIELPGKVYPQLVFFTQLNEVEIVHKLLENGVNVNKLTSSNESALLMAIESLDRFNPSSSLDDELFSLLIDPNHKHTIKTLNARTSKLKLTPLFSAIASCRVDVVQKLVDIGINVKRRAGQHMWTPLYYCLNRIAVAKNPEQLFSKGIGMETLDAVRRSSNGMFGPTLKQNEQAIQSIMREPRNKIIFSAMRELTIDDINKNANIEGLRAIALCLLENGADPTSPEQFPIKGYTPLMSAAEINEPSLFKSMIDMGANPHQTYTQSETGKNINCLQIALGFQSNKVLEVLRHD